MKNSLLERAFIYRFLSLIFSYPEKEQLKELMEALPDLKLSLDRTKIKFSVESIDDLLLEAIKNPLNLKAEYVSLFEADPKAPIRETSYELDKTGRRVIEMADLLGFYTAFGVEPREGTEPDHLSAELEFMSLLLQKEYHLNLSGNKEGARIVSGATEEFLKNHLGRWYEIFSRTLIQTDVSKFYIEMGKFLKVFLDFETKNVKDLNKLKTFERERLEDGSRFECGFM